MICSIIFCLIVTIGIVVLGRKCKWHGFKVEGRDVLTWAIYGYIIPIWIQFDYVFSNMNFLATLIFAIVLSVAFLIVFAVCKKRGFSMLPFVLLATILAYLTLSFVYVSNTSDRWKWFIFGTFRPSDVFGNALYLAPPWIVGLAITRVKPKLGILLPILVLLYNLYSPMIIDKIAHLTKYYPQPPTEQLYQIAMCSYLAVIYAITVLTVAFLMRKVRRVEG